MILNIISSLLGIAGKYIPDKTKLAEFEKDLTVTLTELDMAQISVNKEEAKHNSLFVSGWRPFLGWICNTAFAMNLVIFPVLTFFGFPVPIIDMTSAVTILGGMLGLGTLRTVEKLKGMSG